MAAEDASCVDLALGFCSVQGVKPCSHGMQLPWVKGLFPGLYSSSQHTLPVLSTEWAGKFCCILADGFLFSSQTDQPDLPRTT